MKRLFTILLMFSIVFGIYAIDQAKTAKTDPPREEKRNEGLLNLAVVKIQNPETRQFLKCDSIWVRNSQTTYMPKGMLPLLKMEMPNEQQCRERLAGVLSVHGGRKPDRIKQLGGALATRLPDASCWVHPASGGYKFTVTRDATVKPTQLKDFKEAVQISLDHIARNKLLELTEDEELDIVTVSAVNNVLSDTTSAEQPEEQFISDYYVSFGRRFREIPIVGSYLTLRIDGSGEVVMVDMNWRRIIEVEEKVRITDKPLRELIFNSPEFREMFEPQEVTPEDINISRIAAGYIEAPFNYVQERLRPGCFVSFWVGKTRDEMDSQLLLSLEEQVSVELLLGKRYIQEF